MVHQCEAQAEQRKGWLGISSLPMPSLTFTSMRLANLSSCISQYQSAGLAQAWLMLLHLWGCEPEVVRRWFPVSHVVEPGQG